MRVGLRSDATIDSRGAYCRDNVAYGSRTASPTSAGRGRSTPRKRTPIRERKGLIETILVVPTNEENDHATRRKPNTRSV